MYQNNLYFSSVGIDGIFPTSEKNPWLGNFLNLKLNTRLPTKKKIRKLDVDAFGEEGKRLKSLIHLIVISRGPIGSNMTSVHLLPEEKLEFKDSIMQQKTSLICCF